MTAVLCPEPMSERTIVDRAHDFWLSMLREFGSAYLLRHGVVFDEVYDAIVYPRYEISLDRNADLGVDDFGRPILGQYLPKDRAALVSRTLFENADPRAAFTSWHEVAGHGVLQGNYLSKHAEKYRKLYDTRADLRLFENTFEWQASTFARNVAAPMGFVWVVFQRVFDISRKIPFCGPRVYCLNGVRVYAASPLELAWEIAKRLQHYFGGLSAECIAYQLIEIAVHSNGYDRGGIRGGMGAIPIGHVIPEMVASK